MSTSLSDVLRVIRDRIFGHHKMPSRLFCARKFGRWQVGSPAHLLRFFQGVLPEDIGLYELISVGGLRLTAEVTPKRERSANKDQNPQDADDQMPQILYCVKYYPEWGPRFICASENGATFLVDGEDPSAIATYKFVEMVQLGVRAAPC